MTTTVHSPPRDADDARIDLTTVFELLASQRRRYALHCLFRSERALAVDELARRVALLEDEPTAAHADRVRGDLHHRHLPKLLDEGVLRSAGDPGQIRLSDAADRVAPYLELAAGEFHADA